MYYGGYGYEDEMVEEGSGIFAFLDTLPPWLSTIIMVAGVILASIIVGKIVGRIIGNLIFPDPDKQSLFGLKQRLLIFAIVIATICGTGYVIYDELNPAPPEDMLVDGEIMDGMNPEDGIMTEDGIMAEDEVLAEDGAVAEDGELSEEVTTTEDGEAVESGEVDMGDVATTEQNAAVAVPEMSVEAEAVAVG